MLIVGGICAAVFGAGNLTAHATLGYYAGLLGLFLYNFNIMKRWILFCFMLFTVTACDPMMYSVDFTNNSEYQLIGTYHVLGDPSDVVSIKLEKGNTWIEVGCLLGSAKSAFYRKFPDGKLQLKLYNSEILKDDAEDNDDLEKGLVQVYEINYDDLGKIGWHIYYPPTPEMKDIKMWPPYEEAIKKTESLKP